MAFGINLLPLQKQTVPLLKESAASESCFQANLPVYLIYVPWDKVITN